jgi:hypothetical protein
MQNEDRRESPGADRSAGDPSRRGFLVGSGVAVVLAGGIGAVAAVVTGKTSHSGTRANPPADLLAAAEAERALIAAVDRAITNRSAPATRLTLIRSNHQAHLQALVAAAALAQPSAASTTPVTDSGSSSSATPVSAAQLAALEMDAARSAAATAAGLTGDDAALLASIAACEACHAELLR